MTEQFDPSKPSKEGFPLDEAFALLRESRGRSGSVSTPPRPRSCPRKQARPKSNASTRTRSRTDSNKGWRRHRSALQIPFTFLSAEAGGDVQAFDIGAFAYITKPFDPIALGALIASTLEPSRAEAVWT